jgi:hypothetical protein
MKILICKSCELEFQWYPGKPGLINECPGCAEEDIPVYLAEQGSDDTGVVETVTKNRFRIINPLEKI